MITPLLLLFAALVSEASPLVASNALPGPMLTREVADAFSEASEAGDQAMREKRYASAIRSYKRALAIHDGNDGVWYNLACAHALAGHPAEALVALDRSTDIGRRWAAATADWASKDEDLASLREDPGFIAWLADARDEAPSGPAKVTIGIPPRDADEIQRIFEEAETTLGWMGNALSPRARNDWYEHLMAWRCAAYESIIAPMPEGESRQAAILRALDAVAGDCGMSLWPGTAAPVIAWAETWLAEDGGGPVDDVEARVRLLLAEARSRKRMFDAGKLPEGELDRLSAEILLQAATQPCSPAITHGLVHVLGLRSSDRDGSKALLRRLGECTGSEAALLKSLEEDSEALGVSYAVSGLPRVEMTTMDGRKVATTGPRESVTLIELWATWCGPCVAELPVLRKTWTKWRDAGLDMVSVSIDEGELADPAKLAAWCRKHDMTWPQVAGGASVGEALHVGSIPFAMLIGRDGSVLAVGGALRGEENLEAAIATALGSSGSPSPEAARSALP